jgi:hypothetical protein
VTEHLHINNIPKSLWLVVNESLSFLQMSSGEDRINHIYRLWLLLTVVYLCSSIYFKQSKNIFS